MFFKLGFRNVKETFNGVSVEPTRSLHCVPVAGLIEIMFLAVEKGLTILFQHILSVQKNSSSNFYA
jgi:hypothetical protein